ncbi:Os03g0118425 [Oryza sativa Japonica Group]|uniref:Os03g0118425 protein n=1 Tax=Oryza sativa subsp. japonica TaxID=39947 RepID=A0A0P0VS99_ORYSJ|nr:hypothetical protein EE612_014948 [Oryza sativa]BAS81998.1 Os03g0118425 [Oryza sativa Japonica Group]
MPIQCKAIAGSLYHLKVLEVFMLKSLSSCDPFVWLVPKHFLTFTRLIKSLCCFVIPVLATWGKQTCSQVMS